jgi:signal transduction histidine kinase/CheY-like chemotaxis protein
MNNLFNLAKKLENLICTPQSSTSKDGIQQEILFIENKTLFWEHIVLTFLQGVRFFLSPSKPGLDGLFFLRVIALVAFSFCCRSDKKRKIFHLGYMVVLCLYPPIAIILDESSATMCLWACFNLPKIILHFSKNRAQYVFIIVFEIFMIFFVYAPQMLAFLSKFSPEEINHSFFEVLLLCISVAAVTNFGWDYVNRKRDEMILKTDLKNSEMERQKNFIMNFSHEIRNVINILMGHIQIALLETPKEIFALIEILNKAKLSCVVLSQLISNILDFGKIDIQEIEVTPTINSTLKFVEKIWMLICELMQIKEMKCRMYISKYLPETLKFDCQRLTQILFNLVQNVMKHAAKGDLTIIVEFIKETDSINDKLFEPAPFSDEGLFEKNLGMLKLTDNFLEISENFNSFSSFSDHFRSEIHTDETQSSGMLRIHVIDSGIGMEESLVSCVLKPDCCRSKGEAKKLGLFVSKKICRQMKGNLRVDSKLNQGTVVTICIPVSKVQPHRPESSTRSNLSSIKGLSALIVDDEPFSRFVLKKFLYMMNINVIEEAFDGMDAFHKYVSLTRMGRRPMMITMDINMPNCDGKKSCKLIREFEMNNGLEPCTIIMISANCTESEIKHCLEEKGEIRAQNFLKKPILIEELKKAIDG